MRHFSFTKNMFLLLLLVSGLVACNDGADRADADTDDAYANATADQEQSDEFDAAEIYYNTSLNDIDADPSRYTYYPMGEPDIDAPAAENTASTTETQNDDRVQPLEPRPAKGATYTYDDLDRPPLFAADCADEADPVKCSNQKLSEYIRSQVVYPDDANRMGDDEIEFVTFIVNKDGSIDEDIKIISKQRACPACARAAVTAVENMPDWQPAMRNGKAVTARLTLPVRFEVTDD